MLLAKLKEAKIDGLSSNIEAIGYGIGVKQRDWRASAWILERIAPERFAQQPTNAQVNVQVTFDAAGLLSLAQRALAQATESMRLAQGQAEPSMIEMPTRVTTDVTPLEPLK